MDEGRETRGNYPSQKGEKVKKNVTKTSNAAIQDAAYQVALATRAISHEELAFSKSLGSAVNKSASLPPMPSWQQQFIFPVIVTTAELYVCDFDPIDIDPQTGEIPFNQASLSKCDLLVFEYALPKHLQAAPANLVSALVANNLELFTRMHIFVVHSGYFAKFLESFPTEKSEQPQE